MAVLLSEDICGFLQSIFVISVTAQNRPLNVPSRTVPTHHAHLVRCYVVESTLFNDVKMNFRGSVHSSQTKASIIS
jgi:hypothetical protein